MKVLLVLYAKAPYKTDFCNELGKKVDLTVLYEKKLTNNRNSDWQMRVKSKNFTEIFIEELPNKFRFGLNKEVKKILSDKTYGLIEVCGYGTLTSNLIINYLKRKKIPFIFGADGGIIPKEENKIKYFIKKYFISSASHYLSSGKYTSNYLIHYGADSNCIYEYPFTSLKEEDILKEVVSDNEKTKLKKELKIKEEKMLLSIGSFIYRKGYDILLNSADLLSDNVGLYIIGGKPTEELLKIKSEKNLKNVHFVDFQDKKELAKYYKASDLFIFPTREDIWGLVINEAMAYGLPVVTTDNCIAGLELVENNKNGFIVPVLNGDILCQRANEIINNPDLKHKMSKESLKKIKKYTIEEMSKKHYEIFDEILKK